MATSQREGKLTVVDEGPGIPDGEVAVLREQEATPLEHGCGTGLWLVDRVLEKPGGELSFEDDDGTRGVVTGGARRALTGPVAHHRRAGPGDRLLTSTPYSNAWTTSERSA